jgi:uncharacterized protein YkwD
MALTTNRPKKTTLHKKRQASHHKRSKHYMKAYWPYIPILAVLGLGLVVNTVWNRSAVLGAERNFTSVSLLQSTNDQRATSHEAPLTLNEQLTQAAQAKAEDMVRQNYWAHNSPDGKTPWTFITSSGYQYQAAGENLAYGFSGSSETVAGWMNSTEHRANILNASYHDVGFGVASAPDFLGHGEQTVVVAEYGEPVASVADISFDVNNPQTTNGQVKPATTELKATPVSRIQVLSGGNASWSMLAVTALLGAALAIFIIRHSLQIHRAVSKGEEFVAKHPWFDVAVAVIATLSFLLTRTSGLVR